MNRKIWCTFVLLISWTERLIANSRRTPVVYTNSGPVCGLISHTVWNSIEYSSFRGIPYAKPPTGSLRFQPPVPVKAWNETLNAFQEGNMCPQLDLESGVFMGNEDCLFLNVITPETQFEDKMNLKPVMVWIHGGGFLGGSSNLSLYGPDFFIEENIVFVSFNYRIGALGFLALNHPRATGNAGLKDQNLVLRWVQKNIAAFGGNPKQVTIFGQSAGAASVGFHTLSKKSKGLFIRSISMSGTPLCLWSYQTPQEATAHAHKLLRILGHLPKNKNDMLNFFLHTSASDLVIGTPKVSLNFLPFRPTIENPTIAPRNSAFLTECPVTKYHSGKFYHHSMIMGYTRDEILLFMGFKFHQVNTTKQVIKFLQDRAKYEESISGKTRNQLANLLSNDSRTTTKKILKIGTDFFFRIPIDLTQRMLAKHNENHSIYYYRLSYQSEYSMHRLYDNPLEGAAHLDDIGYIFNVKQLQAPTNPANPFNQFRKRMVALWANFAKYGNPTPNNSSDVVWTDSRTSRSQLDINETFTMHDRLIDGRVEIYEKGLHTALAVISACRHKPVDYKSIF